MGDVWKAVRRQEVSQPEVVLRAAAPLLRGRRRTRAGAGVQRAHGAQRRHAFPQRSYREMQKIVQTDPPLGGKRRSRSGTCSGGRRVARQAALPISGLEWRIL